MGSCHKIEKLKGRSRQSNIKNKEERLVMYKFTYVSSDSGDWSAWYLDGEKLVEGHKITALDLMDVIRHVFPHKLEITYVQDEIVEMGLSESLGDICEIDSDLEEGAWKEFKDCIRMPDPLNTSNELYSKRVRG